MKIYNQYIVTVAITLLITTVILAAVGQNSVEVYYSFYVIEALIITELFIYFNRKLRRSLSIVSTALFTGFILILGFQIFKALVML